MNQNFTKEQSYIRAKKKVKEIKGFYIHLFVYILSNIGISGVVMFGLTKSGYNLVDTFTNFGVYATWIFWGIGMFFHWFGVFGFKYSLGANWEERKIKELMEERDNRRKNL